jgi:hypothetical protein
VAPAVRAAVAEFIGTAALLVVDAMKIRAFRGMVSPSIDPLSQPGN